MSRAGSVSASAAASPLPQLVVLDLDECVWSPEMYTLTEMPGETVRGDLGGRGDGITGVYSGNDVIRIYPGALLALQECHDGLYPGMSLAVASSADTPLAEQIGRAAMAVLEVVPGVTMLDVLTRAPFEDGRNLKIGRQPPLSSNKSKTHFPALVEATGVPFSGMLFFDDSVWCAAHRALKLRRASLASRTQRNSPLPMRP